MAIVMVCLFSLFYNASRLFEYETDTRTIKTTIPQLVSYVLHTYGISELMDLIIFAVDFVWQYTFVLE